MSYDLYAPCHACGYDNLDWNFTSNMGPAWREAGVDLAEFHGKTCGELADALGPAIDLMEKDRDEYARLFDSPNGWGSMDHLIPALRQLLVGCLRDPDAIVQVSR